jgi:hypothetical protein
MAVKGNRSKYTVSDLQQALHALIKAVGVFGYHLAWTVNYEASLVAAKRKEK